MMKHRVQWLLALLFISPYLAGAETASIPLASFESSIRELQFSTRDLDFRVEDLGGKVQNLAVKETPTEIRIELSADVLFGFDKATLLPKAQEALKQVAQVIRDQAKGAVRIDGYTDSKGSATYNQKLSERRANAVRDWLVRREGLTGIRFITQGFGAGNPVAPNTHPDGSDNPEGRQKNRRVEIILKR
jgi:outer membrane protein OmpA-like peptidoglycan-associated protein